MGINVYKNLNINGTICDIVSENGVISEIGKVPQDGIDCKGKKAFAGLIDIHTHGMGGVDTNDATLNKLSYLQAKNGTTSFLPTTTTISRDDIIKVLTSELPKNGANVLGYHLEGPYINKKFIGAQNPDHARNPDINEFKGFNNIKMITLAPELEGAIDYIKKTDAIVVLGHTSADYETTKNAAKAGAKCLTHTFNAMPPLHHREPAVIGAAFDEGMYVQGISDGIHLHPAIVRILYKLIGTEKMILISDSMRATLMPDGEYDLGGLEMTVKNKIARTKDGALAGSTSTLLDCVKCAISFGIPEADAFKMASQTPAELLGIKKGKLCVGYDCDFIVVDNEYNLESVIINGEIFE